VRAMEQEGRLFKGVLYAGLMIHQGEAKVLEFNARFGDPETQPIVARLDTDLIEIIEAILNGTLSKLEIKWKPESAVCVVMASGGYPGNYEKGKVITGLEKAAKQKGVIVFHSGTALKDGNIVTDGAGCWGLRASVPQSLRPLRMPMSVSGISPLQARIFARTSAPGPSGQGRHNEKSHAGKYRGLFEQDTAGQQDKGFINQRITGPVTNNGRGQEGRFCR